MFAVPFEVSKLQARVRIKDDRIRRCDLRKACGGRSRRTGGDLGSYMVREYCNNCSRTSMRENTSHLRCAIRHEKYLLVRPLFPIVR